MSIPAGKPPSNPNAAKGWQYKDTMAVAPKPFEIAGAFETLPPVKKSRVRLRDLRPVLKAFNKKAKTQSKEVYREAKSLGYNCFHYVLSLPRKAIRAYNASIRDNLLKD
ncbi:MAG: hypothetical protein ACI8RA_002109 [Chlamydiales bacterium]|jgi:hypothetical protein